MDASVSSKAIANTFEADVREIVTAEVRSNRRRERCGCRRTAEPGCRARERAGTGKSFKAGQLCGTGCDSARRGTKLEWGNRPERAAVILSMSRLNRVIEHAWADLTVSAEAGCTIAKLQETLAKHGQRLRWMRCGRSAQR